MCKRFFFGLNCLLGMLVSSVAISGELELSFEIPTLAVAEYHRPYIAVWLDGGQIEPISLAVLYQIEEDGEVSDHGEKWLKDLRQWWRRSGRTTNMPVDGISGATRAPGQHRLLFANGKLPLGELKAGNYVLHLEAASEVGTRELIKIPFTWPASKLIQHLSKGRKELGEVSLSIKP